MADNGFKRITAAHLPNFFDADGNRLESRSKCPECGRTNLFQIVSDGVLMRFSGPCGHAFEMETPKK